MIVCAITLNAQKKSKFHNFFGPVDKSVYTTNDTIYIEFRDIEKKTFWLVRPQVSLQAIQIAFEEEVNVKALSAMGIGFSYAHFKKQNDEPYQDLAIDITLLLGQDLQDVSPFQMSLAASVTAWQYLSFGCGYNFKEKYPFILTGISYRFNK